MTIEETLKTLQLGSFNSIYSGFNIFGVLQIDENEVLLCRFIGALLDPNGKHDRGIIPLSLFLKTVLKSEEDSLDLKNAKISLEEQIKVSSKFRQYGRVDIVIHIQDKTFPIEVKIWSGDQQSQLEDYFNFYFNNQKDGVIYYLTPDGRKPSKEGLGKLEEDKVQLLSFSKDIQLWLQEVLKECDSTQMKVLIEQFQEVINLMVANNESMDEIKGLISFDDKEKLDIIKKLWFICQQQNASMIKKDILNKYWEKRIKIDENDFAWGDLSQNPPEIYKSEVIKYIKLVSELDIDFNVWVGVDNRSLYLLYIDNSEGKYTFDRIDDTKTMFDDINEVELTDELKKIKIRKENWAKQTAG